MQQLFTYLSSFLNHSSIYLESKRTKKLGQEPNCISWKSSSYQRSISTPWCLNSNEGRWILINPLMASRMTTFTRLFSSNGVVSTNRVTTFLGLGSGYSSYSSAVASLESEADSRLFGLKDYENYRKTLHGGITHKALLVDAVGTLVIPSQPMAQVSLRVYHPKFKFVGSMCRFNW